MHIETRFLKSKVHGVLVKLCVPSIGYEAAEWVIKNRNVLGWGLDALSMDAGDSGFDFHAHRVVAAAHQIILENVGDKIKDLPARGFFLMALPYKIEGGSGGPTRLVAIPGLTAENFGTSSANGLHISFIFLTILLWITFTIQ